MMVIIILLTILKIIIFNRPLSRNSTTMQDAWKLSLVSRFLVICYEILQIRLKIINPLVLGTFVS
jgi:hypothetical protein